MAPQTDHAPEIGGSVPAFASGSGVTPKVDASQVEHVKSAAEGAKQALDGLGVSVTPNVDTAPVEGLKTAAEGAGTALSGLNTTVAPHVDASSIHAAIGAADTLLSKLVAIKSGAAAASAAVNQASSAASTASHSAQSSLPTMAEMNRRTYGDGPGPGALK